MEKYTDKRLMQMSHVSVVDAGTMIVYLIHSCTVLTVDVNGVSQLVSVFEGYK